MGVDLTSSFSLASPLSLNCNVVWCWFSVHVSFFPVCLSDWDVFLSTACVRLVRWLVQVSPRPRMPLHPQQPSAFSLQLPETVPELLCLCSHAHLHRYEGREDRGREGEKYNLSQAQTEVKQCCFFHGTNLHPCEHVSLTAAVCDTDRLLGKTKWPSCLNKTLRLLCLFQTLSNQQFHWLLKTKKDCGAGRAAICYSTFLPNTGTHASARRLTSLCCVLSLFLFLVVLCVPCVLVPY